MMTSWIVLYAVLGLACYIGLCVWLELLARLARKHVTIGMYLVASPVIAAWPLVVAIALAALAGVLAVAGVRAIVQKLADVIEKRTA